MSLELTLELIGASKDRDKSGFEFTPQDYLLRQPDGTHTRATFDWNDQVLNDLAELSKRKPDFNVVRRFGRTLRKFLEDLKWRDQELERAVQSGEPVHLTFRFEAGELCSLPWECLTLKASGLPLGKVQGCVIRYEWVGARPVPPRTSPEPEGGRLLFAWSAAGGEVPAAAHAEALARACARGHYPFDARRDVLGNVSLERLKGALDASDEPIAALHLLCHGTRVSPSSYGLRWDRVVDAETLASELAPHASRIRMLVLCACQSADPGRLDNDLGSVAVALHRAGFAAVVASRLPLSVQGSVHLAETLYGELLERPASLQHAMGEARQRLVRSSEYLDWASLQLYARAEDGTDYRPFIFRPYRGLLAFQPEHSRFFFGREALQQELLHRVQQAAAGQLPRFQVVAGASGSGKSSLVLAGLVPALPAEQWDVLVMRPGEQRCGSPVAVLRSKLARLWRPAPETSEPATPVDVLSEAEQLRHARPGPQLLLVVDQLEEVFTQVSPAVERQTFVGALWELTQASGLGVTVVSTLRVDYFERCGEVAVTPGGGRLDKVVYSDAHRMFVPQLEAEHLAEVIERPAHAVGIDFDHGLVQLLQRDLGQEPGTLPLLEYALDLLWEQREGRRMTHAAYNAMGGVTGALTRTADQLYESLTVPEQRQARRLLLGLVEFGNDTTPHTRRRAWLQQVLPSQAEARECLLSVLEKFVVQRLLLRGSDQVGTHLDNRIWVEVAHETLIRRWARILEWLKEYGERSARVRQFQMLAELWRLHEREDDRKAYLLKGKQLTYAQSLDESELSDDVSQFVSASIASEAKQRHVRMLRRRGSALLAIMSIAFGYCGFQIQQRLSIDRKVSEDLMEARQQLDLAKQVQTQRTAARAKAFALYDVDDKVAADPAWAEVEEAGSRQRGHFDAASEKIERANLLAPSRPDTQEVLERFLLERALLAEEEHDSNLLGSLLRRLRLLDQTGTWQQRWEAPVRLTLEVTPSLARVALRPIVQDPNGRRTLGPPLTFETPSGTLPPGNYQVEASALGYEPAVLPVHLLRGEERREQLPLIAEGRLPKGFAYVPPGGVLFGTSAEAGERDFYDTVPLHSRSTPGFLIARLETTYEDWIQFLEELSPAERDKRTPKVKSGLHYVELKKVNGRWLLRQQHGSEPSEAFAGEKIRYSGRDRRSEQDWLKLPVSGISFDDAQAYARWLAASGRVPGARLCTDVEWERAARGADGREYAHGDRLEPDDANFDRTYGKQPNAFGPDEVGSHPNSRSPFGVDDMIGNIWEFASSSTNPNQPVLRGGSYYYGSKTCRAFNRDLPEPAWRDIDAGLRVCADVEPR